MDDERIEPTYLGERFTCPHCDHRTGQSWHGAQALGNHESYQQVVCQSCTMAAIWVSDATFVTQKGGRPKFGSTSKVRMVYPAGRSGPRPHSAMPDDVERDYQEARDIAAASPRGACALLRLALQRLCVHLGWQGRPDDMNNAIQHLVNEHDLRQHLQQALDSVRVTGGEAVHPGQMDDVDDPATAVMLMRMLNRVVEDLIAGPAEIESFYDGLPQSKRDGIDQRQARADAASADED